MLNKNIIKKSTLLLSFLSLLSVATIAQNNYLKIYHGMGNETRIFQGKTTQFDGTWNEDIKIIKAKESLITIEIINPNPFFYKYEIKTEDFDIKDNFPDLSELLSAINAIKDLSSSQSSNSGNRSALLNDNPSNGLKKYQDILADLYDNINSAKNFLLRSDPPESIQEALGYTGTNGFRGAIKNIEDLPGGKPNEKGLFNSESLQKDLDSFLGAAENDGTLFTGITNNDIKKGYKEAFELLNKQLTATVDEIKKTIKTENRVLIFTVSVKDKGTKIKLVITKKDSRAKRMEIDQTIAMIYPEYGRNSIELIPVANMTYASNVNEFSINNGVITSQPGDGFKFKVGAMLLFNIIEFGKYKEGSWGMGLGYNIPKKNVFESFYIGTMFSYKNTFRIGAGFGFSEYPNELKDGIKVGSPLPQNVSNLEDVVISKRKPSFFLSFSIAGITLKK